MPMLNTAHTFGISNQSGTLATLSFFTFENAPVLINKAAAIIRSHRLTHSPIVKDIVNQLGQRSGFICEDESIEVTFDLVSSGATRAGGNTGAAKSIMIPQIFSPVIVRGNPVMPIGWITDDTTNGGLNSNDATDPKVSNGYPFIYMGGSNIDAQSEDAWTGSITLVRFKGIPTWTFGAT